MGECLVLYPSPGMGHLIAMVELGKFIVSHYPDEYEIIILTLSPPFNTGSTASYIKSVSASTTSITFHTLPDVVLPLDLDSYTAMEVIIYDLIRLSNHHVHLALQSISSSGTSVSAFIMDFFCSAALSVTASLNIPTYFFFTSGANCLATFFYFPTLHESTTESFKDMFDQVLDIPGLPPLPAADMIQPMLDRTTPGYAFFLDTCIKLPTSAGIIINTFNALEDKFLKSISQGTYDRDGPTPPLFCLGPLIPTGGQGCRGGGGGGGGGMRQDCLEWLDKQPSQSVVYLCFGSLGLFSAEQLREIAIGLERSV